MFFKAWSVSKSNIEEGMPLMAMAKAMQDLDRKNPGMTVDQMPSSICLYQSPKAKDAEKASVRIVGGSEEVAFDRNGIAWIPTPARVLIHLSTGADHTLAVAPNGSARLTPGINETLPWIEVPPEASALVQKAAQWLATGEVGASSRFMCATIAGLGQDRSDRAPHPLDTADLGRCLGFLQAVPEARSGLGKMKSASPQWKALVERWEELESAMIEGDDRKKAAALIDEILDRPQPRKSPSPR